MVTVQDDPRLLIYNDGIIEFGALLHLLDQLFQKLLIGGLMGSQLIDPQLPDALHDPCSSRILSLYSRRLLASS